MAKQQANLRLGSGSVPWLGGKSWGGGPGLTITGLKVKGDTAAYTHFRKRHHVTTRTFFKKKGKKKTEQIYTKYCQSLLGQKSSHHNASPAS